MEMRQLGKRLVVCNPTRPPELHGRRNPYHPWSIIVESNPIGGYQMSRERLGAKRESETNDRVRHTFWTDLRVVRAIPIDAIRGKERK